MSRSPRILLALSLLFISVSSASIEGLYPDAGPTDGATRVTVFSSSWKGLNYSSHPTPKCQFEDHTTPQPASWIHCSGTDLSASSEKSATCLNCESPPHASAGNATIKVSIKGDFTDTLTSSFHYYTPPTVIWSTPFIGRKHGGTFVTVHGSNFENLPALGCVFGTIIVPATYVSSSVLTCLSPPSDAVDTPIPLKVTQNVQQSTQSTIQYYYYSIPEISELVPNSGPTSGGTHVYIKGRQMYPFQTSNLDIANTTFVRFGEKKVKGTLMNTTHSEVYSPAVMYEGPAIVEITFNDQEWTDNGIPFYYYLPPYVLEIIPSFGPLEGKTNVTVIGANFHDSKEIKCRFGDKVVEGHFIDEVKVWCLTPSATQSGYVPFSLALTQDRFSGNDIKYLYVDPPVISEITPPCGPTTGFTQIAVKGKNFIYIGKDKSLCIFDDKYQQPATVFNDTLIYCDSPSIVDKFGNNVHNIKSLNLKITLNQVDYVAAKTNFSYYNMPSVSSISPMNGPFYGGTNIVVDSTEVKDFCALTCRFGTMEVPGHLNTEGKVACASPVATCAGKTVVQISLNGQQYTNNYYDVHPSIFYYYPNLILSYVQPDSVPTSGGSIITIYGEGYLMSRNTTISTSTGIVMISYDCKFSSSDEATVYGTTTAVYVDNNIIKCPTPPISTPTNGVLLKVSPNGQNWHPVHVSRINFYRAPEISDISPKFGKIKQKNTTLNVYGSNFDCPNNQCTDVKCSFNTADMSIVTEGSRQSSSLIICQIPPISRPEVTTVQVSLNGIDYTNSNATYTFYDAFVLAVDPPYIPVEGNTIVRLIGYGFADTQQIKVKLQDSNTGQALSCGGNPCILPATFISQSEIQFTAPAQSTVTDASGNSIGFKRFVVEASVYEDSYTNNGIEIQYFEQPVVGKLNSDGTPKVLHANTLETIRTPVQIKVPTGTSRTSFLNFAKIRCRFQTTGDPIVTVGIIVNYPFPSEATGISDDYSRIECPTPKFENLGSGDVSVSLNGRDFVGKNPILVKPELKLLSVAPTCGPKEGGTQTIMSVEGFGDEDINNLFFSWSTVCTSVLTNDLWTPPTTLSTITPPVERVTESPGGTSLVVYSLHRKTEFTNTTTIETVQHYLDSSAEFLFYVEPIVLHTHPHSGRALGGTPVILEGAFFFSDKQHGCTPKCKFGDLIVEAEFLSTVRLRCNAPVGLEGLTVPLTVSMNGHDTTPSHPDQTYTFTSPPTIHSIHPSSGPSSGGTPIMVVGVKYVDLSTYPDEFLCVFTSTKNQQVKKTPANYLNDTTILCTSPGGWGAGSIATVQITYNGVDLSNNNNTFRFYQVDSIFPLSGPSIGGTPILIKGSGFDTLENGGNAACKINNQISKATFTNWSQIICTAPPAQLGPSFKEHVDFYYTLDGKDWHKIHKGFTYYPQPSVSEIIPGFIAQDGGTIEVNGENFLDNYYETHLSCKIGNTVGTATYVNETHAKCTFPPIDVGKQAEHHLQMSLNDVTYTTLGSGSKINVFYVTKMTPISGIVQGGTQITVEGQDFPEGKTPLCRFGARMGSTITFGTPVSTSQVVCTSPAADLPANAELPFEVMFSLTFEDDTYNLWEYQGLYYYYYEQPVVETINPRSALLDQASTIVVASTAENLFGDAIIGSKVTTDAKTLDHNIQCRFGRFGTTKGALLENNKISCPTPNTKLNLEEIGEEPVKMEVAMNGQDFTSTSSVYFKFVGSKSPSSYGIAWMIAILIGTIVLVFLIYFIVKAFRQGSGVGTNSLNKPYNDQQRLSPNRPSQGIPL